MTNSHFFSKTDLDPARTQRLVDDALHGAEDGELYLEHAQSEAFVFDDNRLKTANFDVAQGFGLRAVNGETTGFAHASDLSEPALKRAADAVAAIRTGAYISFGDGPTRTNQQLYTDNNPLSAMAFGAKTKLLENINAYARDKDERVRQVSCSLTGEWSVVEIRQQ
ncbi:MAG: DNA gyrase modulator, partial [Pseudomonadota bacterium]